MEWKTKIATSDAQLEIPSYVVHDRPFELTHNGQRYVVRYHEKLSTLFVRRPEEKVYRNIKLKRVKITKSEDSPEFGFDTEFLSAASLHSSDVKGETWIYTPASEQRRKAQAAKGATLRSPMTGKVLQIKFKNGDFVKKGDVLLVIEAMKMENKITSPVDGRIDGLKTVAGDNVNANDLLAQISPQTEAQIESKQS